MLNRTRLTAALLIGGTILALGAGCRNASTPSGASPRTTITLAAVGDVLLARGVGRQIGKHGADWPFDKTRDIIRDADIAFCNLECTLSERGVPQRRRYLFRADPKLAEAIRKGGFDVACLANNHTLDFGRDAMTDTIAAVRDAGMTSVGAGRDRADALRVRIVERKGLRVGFVAYTDIPSCGVVRRADKPTVAGVNADELPQQIRAARAACDVLVVSFHWGVEYMKKPTERQRSLARTCIDNGADLILGHHPHVLQPVERYKERTIVYSMGGFVWDAKLFGADHSAIYLIELGPSSAKLVRTVPVHVVKCQPRPSESLIR